MRAFAFPRHVRTQRLTAGVSRSIRTRVVFPCLRATTWRVDRVALRFRPTCKGHFDLQRRCPGSSRRGVAQPRVPGKNPRGEWCRRGEAVPQSLEGSKGASAWGRRCQDLPSEVPSPTQTDTLAFVSWGWFGFQGVWPRCSQEPQCHGHPTPIVRAPQRDQNEARWSSRPRSRGRGKSSTHGAHCRPTTPSGH